MLFSFLVMSVWERMPALLSMGYFFLNGTWNSYFSRAVTLKTGKNPDINSLKRRDLRADFKRMPTLLCLGHFFLNGTLDSHFLRAVTKSIITAMPYLNDIVLTPLPNIYAFFFNHLSSPLQTFCDTIISQMRSTSSNIKSAYSGSVKTRFAIRRATGVSSTSYFLWKQANVFVNG